MQEYKVTEAFRGKKNKNELKNKNWEAFENNNGKGETGVIKTC